MAYKLEIPKHTEHQIDNCVNYIFKVLKNPSAARAVLDDIEHTYNQLEEMAEEYSLCEDSYLRSKGYRKLVLEKLGYLFTE
ncbi:MAG: type II toxin-antitoxin system RelE/ParE family toxin [Oscillospiraceae bacterium]|jgi:plasmid stabilization system protein ParE